MHVDIQMTPPPRNTLNSSSSSALTYDEIIHKINQSTTLSTESKQIFKMMTDLFKSGICLRASKVAELEQRVELGKAKSDAKIETLNGKISELNEQLDSAKSSNIELRKQLSKAQNCHDELEPYGRRESLIFSGEKVPQFQPNENCVRIAHDLLRGTLEISDDPPISTAHRIGKPPAPDTNASDRRSIIVKFCKRDDKFLVQKAAKEKKIKGLFVNESLTPTRNKILNVLRACKKMKNKLVTGTYTHNGRVFAFVKQSKTAPDEAQKARVEINTREALEDCCSRYIEKSLETFVYESGQKMFP